MHTCIEAEHYDGRLWICASDEFKHHNYTPIMLEGFSGSFQTEYLQMVKLDSLKINGGVF